METRKTKDTNNQPTKRGTARARKQTLQKHEIHTYQGLHKETPNQRANERTNQPLNQPIKMKENYEHQ